MTQSNPDNWPDEVRLNRDKNQLALRFSDLSEVTLSAEFLRTQSPSAEVKGHSGQGGQLPVNKQLVTISALEPVGSYAVRIIFSDGHDTGFYSWDYLVELAHDREALWDQYLKAAGRTS